MPKLSPQHRDVLILLLGVVLGAGCVIVGVLLAGMD